MRKTVLSVLAGLALCSTATAAVITTNARAEQPARKPVMIAQAGGQRGAEMDRERQPRCSDIVADKADDMAWLERSLSLTGAQAPLFAPPSRRLSPRISRIRRWEFLISSVYLPTNRRWFATPLQWV